MTDVVDSLPAPPAQSNDYLKRKTVCVVTGASRGIGKALVDGLTRRLGAGSAVLIVARNNDALNRVASEMRAKNTDAHVETLTMDLARFFDHSAVFDNALKNLLRRSETFDLALLIHNAGSLGPLDKRVDELDDARVIRDYMEMNFVSFVLLNNAFLKAVASVASEKLVVNITSLAAIAGLPGMGIYSAGKAAREGFIRSMAVDNLKVKVLNYAPGPVDTDMLKTLGDETWHDRVRNDCKNCDGNFKPLTAEQTANRLLNILSENKFSSGARIDYFDTVGS